MKIDEVLEEIIKDNEGLFNDEELMVIKNNFYLIRKIYLIGLLNSKEIYGKKLQ